MANFNMNDYVSVAERLNQASDKISMVITEPPVMLTDVMGFTRATVSLTDGRSATGLASFRLDLQGRGAQATFPLEDAETSAIGRALAFLGYSSSKSIASREEMQEVERRQAAPAAEPIRKTGATGRENGTRAPLPAGTPNAPLCDVCGATGRLGKDGRSFYCPDKDAHGGKWYTITRISEEVDLPL